MQFNPTPNRIDFERFLRDLGVCEVLSRTIGRVTFPDVLQFGDRLVGDDRYGTLFDTLRAQGQKMIDTAIVADALCVVASRHADLAVILSDDDDFFPAVVTGEVLGGRVYLLRHHEQTINNIVQNTHCPSVAYWC
jgi:uncharacterized LabA/DUF88 family protein